MFRRLRLGTQFTLLLTLIFLGGIILSGITLSQALQRRAEDKTTTKAEILTQTMNVVRTYTSDHIAPLLQDQLETTPTFINEVVPAFSARQAFENFRNQPDLAKLLDYRNNCGLKQFFTARPLLIKEASCLQCHSHLSVAPESQIASFGLVFTQQFCKIMGEDIQVESEVGQRTTFTIRLSEQVQPLQPEPFIQNEPNAGALVMSASTVLVIDDVSVHDIMQRFLSREGFNVITAASGQEGLRLARNRPQMSFSRM